MNSPLLYHSDAARNDIIGAQKLGVLGSLAVATKYFRKNPVSRSGST